MTAENAAMMTAPRDSVDGSDLMWIRARVSDVLNRLGAQMLARMSDVQPGIAVDDADDAETVRLRSMISNIGRIASGLAVIDPECLPTRGAGYGSDVVVINLETSEREEYSLTVGPLIDIDSGQVSLASPIGRALLGRVPGDEVTIVTPEGRKKLMVIAVCTLQELLEDDETFSVVG
jgi:transcription elongation factor GreA